MGRELFAQRTRRIWGRPIHPLLVQAARDAGMEEIADPNDVWDSMRFTDLFTNPDHKERTRKLDKIELAGWIAIGSPPLQGLAEEAQPGNWAPTPLTGINNCEPRLLHIACG